MRCDQVTTVVACDHLGRVDSVGQGVGVLPVLDGLGHAAPEVEETLAWAHMLVLCPGCRYHYHQE